MSDRDRGLGMEKRVVLAVYIDHWLLMALMKRNVPLYPSFPFAVSFLSVTPRERRRRRNGHHRKKEEKGEGGGRRERATARFSLSDCIWNSSLAKICSNNTK